MLDQLETLAETAKAELDRLDTGSALDGWNSNYIGRRGELTQMLRRVSDLPQEERPAFGRRANQLKKELELAFEEKVAIIKAAELEQSMAEGALDVTLPGRPISRGRLHPSSQTLRRIF
jgi:phenylalanyl-tRNA synthetase alpha chain